jgi:outer membrane lipoprotein SlyB
MSKNSVFCIATTHFQAEQIVENLKLANFSNNDISVLFPDKETSRDFAHEKNTKAPEGAITGASTGGVIGGVLGWIAGIGALAIPGVGPFIAAGPIVAAISGVAIGGTVGAIAGALIGLGIPEIEAKRYENKVKDGNILVSVHTENSDQVKAAKRIFEQTGAQDICTAGESAAPKGHPASEDVSRRTTVTPTPVTRP